MSDWHHDLDHDGRRRQPVPIETLHHIDGVQWFDAPAPPRQHDCWAQTSAYDVFGALVAERCACGAVRLCDNPYREHPWLERNSRDDAPQGDRKLAQSSVAKRLFRFLHARKL